jgi:hypothetical protein
MWVELTDGRPLSVLLAWFQRPMKATPAQRDNVEIGRVGLHWDDIDEDISIAGLLAGRVDVTHHQPAPSSHAEVFDNRQSGEESSKQ